MSRKLDAAIAEALEREVTWMRKVKTGGRRIKPVYTHHACSPTDNFAQPYYAGTYAVVPKFSKDGNAMLRLDAEMRARGWVLSLTYCWSENRWYTTYKRPQREIGAKNNYIRADGTADTMPLAVALAAYKALTGKEWERS